MVSEKEVYRLWREYLKESRYAKFCERLRNYKGQGLPEWFKSDPFSFHYWQWGDITIPFKTWWEWWSKKNSNQNVIFDRHTQDIPKKKAVSIYSGKGDTNFCLNELRGRLGREPSAVEFIEFYTKYIEGNPDSTYLKVDHFETNDIEDLRDQFTKLIRKQRKIPLGTNEVPAKEYVDNKKRWREPTKKNPPLRELRRYLDLYRQRVIHKVSIIQLELEGHNGDTVRRDIRYAKRIIENVEQGYFPGDYQDK